MEELFELLRIPSVSADPARSAEVERAAEWVRDFIRAAGGEAEVVQTEKQPLVIGEIRASENADQAPTVIAYGHFDVQPEAPLDLWESPPFEPTVRDGWIYARGVADDKGQLYLQLKAAALLAAEGALPVNVRFTCDGEEESGGHSIVDFLEADARGGDACIIFDGHMPAPGQPAFCIATRGICYFHVRVKTGERDLHSGLFGGAALNASHVLMQVLEAVLPRDGAVPETLRAGMIRPSDEEIASWDELESGEEVLAAQGARPSDAKAAEELYLRTVVEPAVDVHGLLSGSPQLQKTVIAVEAEANVSIRIVPGQDDKAIAAEMERLMREAAPEGAEVEIETLATAPAALVKPDDPVIRLGQDAFERAVGRAAAPDPSGRLATGDGRSGAEGDPDDPHRFRPAGREHPLPERALPGRVRHPRRRGCEGAVPLARRAALVPGRRVVRPAAAEHGRDDLHLG